MSLIADVKGTAPIAPLRTPAPPAVDSWVRAVCWRLMGERARAWRDAMAAGGASSLSEDDLVMLAITETLQAIRSSGR